MSLVRLLAGSLELCTLEEEGGFEYGRNQDRDHWGWK
jgi:hypothetical protein